MAWMKVISTHLDNASVRMNLSNNFIYVVSFYRRQLFKYTFFIVTPVETLSKPDAYLQASGPDQPNYPFFPSECPVVTSRVAEYEAKRGGELEKVICNRKIHRLFKLRTLHEPMHGRPLAHTISGQTC